MSTPDPRVLPPASGGRTDAAGSDPKHAGAPPAARPVLEHPEPNGPETGHQHIGRPFGPGGGKHRLGRLVRAGFLLLVGVLASYYVLAHRQEIARAWQHVALVPVCGAVLAGALAAWSGAPAWQHLLAGLGFPLRLRDAQRVFLLGQLGKYIPGGVWTVLAQVTMARELHVPAARSGTASLTSILLAVVTASGLGAACLAVAGHEVLGRYWWLLLLALPLLALLQPDVLVRAGVLIGRVTGRKVALPRMPERTLLTAAGWLVAGQVLNGLGFYLLVDSISGRATDPLLSIGLFALAAAAGIVVIFLPAGVGAREVILVFGLTTFTDPGSAALIVLLSRVVLTVVDVGLAGAAAGVGRRRRTLDPVG